MILQRSLARILQEWLLSENTCKNLARTELCCKFRKHLKLSRKNHAKKRLIYLTDISCKKIEQISIFLQEFCRNLAFLAPLARFLQFSARIMHYLVISCKKLPRILQVLSDRLTRASSFRL